MYYLLLGKFLLFTFLIFYTYIGYSIALLFIARFRKKRALEKDEGFEPHPSVTFLIAAYNEERAIGKKIENILELNYPKNKITVYIVSDSSTDNTHGIVKSFNDDRVRLIVSDERRGKTHCENIALEEITDDYIIFTDASTLLESDCLIHLVQHFAYKQIGCVSTRDSSITSEINRGENLYVRYEMATRQLESKVESIVGLSGSCYAARKSLCTELPDHLTRDFALPLIARERGYVSIDEPQAICYVKPTGNMNSEFQRKVRTFTNGISTLMYKKGLLNVSRYGWFSFMLWSHKVFRWLLPFFFIIAFLTNVFLMYYKRVFRIILMVQLAGYLFSTLGFFVKSNNIVVRLSRITLYICMTNIAGLITFYRYLKGDTFAKWDPTVR